MNRTNKHNSEIDLNPIDNILVSEEKIIPSSGFLASVMERVDEEARQTAPIRFPWKRAVPGILLASGVFGMGAYELVRQAIPAARAITFTQPHLSVSVQHPLEQAAWVAFALACSLASWLLSRRLAGQSGLL